MLASVHEGQNFFWTDDWWWDQDGRPVSDPAVLESLVDQQLSMVKGVFGSDWMRISRYFRHAGMDLHSQANLRLLGAAALRSMYTDEDPTDSMCILCQCLRFLRLPEEALKLLEPNRPQECAQLLICQASCLCDLGRWQEAEGVLQPALGHPVHGAAAKQVRFRLLARARAS